MACGKPGREPTLLIAGAGGIRNESKNYNGLHGLQAKELQYYEEQEKRSRQD
jgi:hypothetical protein